MTIEYSAKTKLFFAQAYGSDSYGTEEYGDCEITADGCVQVTTTGAPNTGFLGLTPDAAIASGAGALLIAIAITGAVTVLLKRRSRKTKTQE
jgi:hypothetical protein